jgi:hypothetical protein
MIKVFVLSPRIPVAEPAWKDSRYADVCMVYAASEDEARTLAAEAFDPGKFDKSPWMNPDLSLARAGSSHGGMPPDDYRGVHFISDQSK